MDQYQTNENCNFDTLATEIPNILRFGPETSTCSRSFQICQKNALFTITTETGHNHSVLFCRPVFWQDVGYNCKFHTSGEDQDNCGYADDEDGIMI